MVHGAAAEGFEAGADAYARARPSYPGEVVDRIAGLVAGGLVLDLAAGTGILTRMLRERQLPVVAAEPIAAMRTKLAAAMPGISVVAAVAEHLPFPDASLRAVTVAQAFHWFDVPRAFAELERCVEPGGRVVIVFNIRDDRADWVRSITELIDPYEDAVRVPRYRDGAWRPDMSGAAHGFQPGPQWTVDHEQPMDAEGLATRVESTSFIARLPSDERERVRARVLDLTRSHPDLIGRERFGYPYRCETTVLLRNA